MLFPPEPEQDVERLSAQAVQWHLGKQLYRVELQLDTISDTLEMGEPDLIRPWHDGHGVLYERNWRVWARLNTLETTREYLRDTLGYS